MRWRGNRKSSNVEDRRSMRASRLSGGNGGGGLIRLLPMLFKFLGLKGTVILVACVGGYGLLTGNLGSMLSIFGLQPVSTVSSTSKRPIQESAAEKELVDFVSVILADTEETWNTLFQKKGN